jgi:hypothetical protein
MFAHLHGFHGLHRPQRLDRLAHVADPALAFAEGFTRRGAWRRRSRVRRRREPPMVLLLLAGLAVFAFVKVMSAARGRRSTVEKVLLAALLLALGVVVLSFRRSSARYR